MFKTTTLCGIMSSPAGLLLIGVVISTTLIPLSHCTFDLNDHELQYVSDHLSENECKLLMKDLNSRLSSHPEKQHGTNSNSRPSRKASDEHLLPRNPSCLDQLKVWNIKDGKIHTFYSLVAALKRINKPALASRLSRTVFHVKADSVQRTFLGDPFKQMIHTGSPLLVESSPSPPPEPPSATEPQWSSSHTISLVSVIGAVLLVTMMITCAIRANYQRKLDNKTSVRNHLKEMEYERTMILLDETPGKGTSDEMDLGQDEVTEDTTLL